MRTHQQKCQTLLHGVRQCVLFLNTRSLIEKKRCCVPGILQKFKNKIHDARRDTRAYDHLVTHYGELVWAGGESRGSDGRVKRIITYEQFVPR